MITLDDLIKQRGDRAPDKPVCHKIRAVAKALGIILARDSKCPYSWDGRRINLALGMMAGDVIHEIGHFQMATSLRRRRFDFGLGEGVHSTKFSKVLVKSKDDDDEESYASILGILWERALGYNHIETLHEHNWIGYDDRDPWGTAGADSSLHRVTGAIRWLTDNGFLDERGNPQIKVRKKEPLPRLSPYSF